MTRRKLNAFSTFIAVFALIPGGLAFADNLTGDIVGAETTQKNVVAGSSFSFDSYLFVTRHGQATSSVTWSGPVVQAGTCTGISGTAATPAGMSMPTGWSDQGNGSRSIDYKPDGTRTTSTADGVARSVTISGTAGAAGTSCKLRWAGTGTHIGDSNVDLTVNFVAPTTTANTPPTISVTGVTHGESYEYGSVPAAGCSVVDTEDGNSSPAATLSPITGTLSSYGLGSQTATCSYTDSGLLEASASATYSIVDTTPPAFSCSPAAAGTTWQSANQSHSCTAEDNVALNASSPSSFTLSTNVLSGDETSDASTGSQLLCDVATNCVTAGPISGWKIDRKAPTSTVTGFTSSQVFVLGVDTLPTPGCSASDGGSGVASHGTPTSSGGPVGTISVTCNGAVDNVGNTQTVGSTASYVVRYNFGDFQQPVVALPTRNTVKAGRGVPIKFSLGGYQGMAIFANSSATSPGGPLSSNISCSPAGTDPIEETVTAGSSTLQYDSASDTYTYVWKTETTWAGKCRTLHLNLNDGSPHHISFGFTK